MWRSKLSAAQTTQPKFIDVEAVDLANDGRGVAKRDGRVIFVDGLLPGERAKVMITSTKGKFWEAQVQKRLNDSADRVQPSCEFFESCGGCQLQHLAHSAQNDLKARRLERELARHKLTFGVDKTLSFDPLQYRRRARIGVQYSKGLTAIGFRAAQTNRVIDVDHCGVLNDALQPVYSSLRRILVRQKQVTHVDLVDLGGQVGVHLRCKSQIDPQLIEALRVDNEIALKITTDSGIEVNETWVIDSSGIEITIGPEDFLQANIAINNAMLAQVKAWFSTYKVKRPLELFSGLGNFSFALRDQVEHLYCIEGSEAMVERARSALSVKAGDRIRFEQANLFDPDLTLPEGSDAILLDPPRDGAQEACKQIAAMSGVRCVVYVSCDFRTFARDAALLASGGYQLEELIALDMFPQSAHSESMALFIKNNKK